MMMPDPMLDPEAYREWVATETLRKRASGDEAEGEPRCPCGNPVADPGMWCEECLMDAAEGRV